MYGQLTTVEFESTKQRKEALVLLSESVQRIRVLPGFQAAYYLDVDELQIVVVAIFDSERDLDAIQEDDEELRARAAQIGVRFPRTDRYPVVAFATSGAP